MPSQRNSYQISIYSYLNYREFLLDIYKLIKEDDQSYSYRKFSGDLGFSSLGYIRNVIIGNKNLGKSGLFKISEYFDMNLKERDYFEEIVKYDHASTVEEKKSCLEKIKRISPTKFHRTITDDLSYFLANRACSLIGPLILIYGNDFSPEPLWIAEKLKIKLSESEIKKALLFLIEKEIIIVNNGTYQYQSRALRAQDAKTPTSRIQKFHKSILKESEHFLDISVEEREFNSQTMTIPKKKIEGLKEKIKEKNIELVKWIHNGEPKDGNQPKICVSINSQMYPLTK